MKFKLLLLLSLVLQSHLLFAQSKEVKFLIDTTVLIMKNNAVNAGNVNWDMLKNGALIKAANVNNPYELGPTMRYLYQSINDFHGAFFYRDSIFRWTPVRPATSDSIRNEWTKGVKNKTELLDNNIGYLRIPSMPGGSKKEYDTKAQSLNDSLCFLLTKGVKGIILDLRLNGGGAMFPMILGLQQLLSQGQVGAFQVKKTENWILKDNSFFIDTSILSSIIPTCNINAQSIPIVMLIGSATGSSGEFLIIAFKDRTNTILLGDKTAGYVTVNTGIQINNTAFMNLAVGYGLDKRGKAYTEAIEPDILFSSVDKFNNIKNDEKVKAAVKWLKDHTK